jgi:hypothetical protein
MTSMALLKHGKNYGITVYVPNETILKKVAAKIERASPFLTQSRNLPIHLIQYAYFQKASTLSKHEMLDL